MSEAGGEKKLLLEPNGVHCIDCNTYYEEEMECPEDPQNHGYLPVHIAQEALGRDDDEDAYHSGLKLWIYDVENQ